MKWQSGRRSDNVEDRHAQRQRQRLRHVRIVATLMRKAGGERRNDN
jgi:hypothetical protein